MLSLEPYADRREIPVFPHMLTAEAPIAGYTQAEVYDDLDKWLDAIDKTIQTIGSFDVSCSVGPRDTVFIEGLKSRRPGHELDGATDIQAAYDILCGHHSIRGDIPATMLAFGTADEVSEYCEKLVTMGMKGDFMLSSGCEVPTNAKTENLKAFINFLK